MRITALGGGHGLSATLRAARLLSTDVTAVVSMADDGGSSGRLRDEFDVPPPGDVRMALLALSDATDLQRQVWGHRFAGDGPLAGHNLGNLVLTALWQQAGSAEKVVVAGIAQAGRMLGSVGQVLPVSTHRYHLQAHGRATDGTTSDIVGQSLVNVTTLSITGLGTQPSGIPACPEALTAIAGSDVVVLGPGSWFTSVLAPLCIDGVVDAISRSEAHVILVLNLRPQQGETSGYEPADYLHSLRALYPSVQIGTLLADDSCASEVRPVADGLGWRVVSGHFADDSGAVHRPTALAEALKEACEVLTK